MTKQKAYIRLVFFCLLCASDHLFAQQNDACAWFKTSIEKKINQRWSVELSSSLRLRENYSQVGGYNFQLSTEYVLLKSVNVGLAYRYSGKRDFSLRFKQRDRMSIWAEYKLDLGKRFTIKARTMFQEQYTDRNFSEKGHIPLRHLREKIELQYKTLGRHTPFIFAEMYYKLKYNKREISRWRLAIGNEIEFNKRNKTTVFYMYQPEINEPYPFTYYILGVEHKFIF